MMRLFQCLAMLGLCLLLAACATEPSSISTSEHYEPNWDYQPGPVEALPTLDLAKTIEPNDRVVFIGDEMTQQMFYSRGVAAALLSLMPDANLRFFNAGRDGATAASAIEWTPDVLKLTRASVVLICLGLNDAMAQTSENQSQAQAFTQHLEALVDEVRKQPEVRKIILVGPPAVQAGLTENLPPDSYNARLIALSDAAKSVAEKTGAAYIDLFIHTSAVYLGQMTVGGDPLTLGGKLPSEEGHVIIASVLLRGLGVTGKQLDQIAFCPLLPSKMGRIRPALALPTTPPTPEASAASRGIYLSLIRFDEAFFKRWRLAGRNRLSWTPAEAETQMELRWGNVTGQVQQLHQVLDAAAAQKQP